MFDDIIQPFLTDAEQRHALVFAQGGLINAPVEMADDPTIFQLHFAHQRTYRLFKGQIVELTRAQTTQQPTNRVVNPQRELLNKLAALFHAAVFRRQTLHNPGLGTNRGDRLADVIMQFARDVPAHALFRFQQPLRQPPVARQFALQRLVQLAQTLNTGAQQQPGQALRQQ